MSDQTSVTGPFGLGRPNQQVGGVCVYFHADRYFSLVWFEDEQWKRADSKEFNTRAEMAAAAADTATELDNNLKQKEIRNEQC